MAETGWPLIPREALPAVARKGSRRPPAAGGRSGLHAGEQPGGRQLSIFGAETTEASPFDLAGLLAGPGRLDRMGGTARVSMRVDAAWRVHVLVAELVSRGLVVNWRTLQADDQDQIQDLDAEVRRDYAPPESGAPPSTSNGDVHPVQDHGPASDTSEKPGEADGSPGRVARPMLLYEVRTAYSSRLNALARAWPAAADQLFLSGPRLRLWVAAAGRPVDGGYALGSDRGDLGITVDPGTTVDAALRRAGLEGALSDHGLLYLISGRKRLHRLAELVGERPAAAPAALWPGDAGA